MSRRRRTLMEAVEPRLLFSADPAAPLVEALAPPPSVPVLHLDLTPPALEARYELVVVDAGVAGFERLVEDLRAHETGNLRLEIVVLDPTRDGVAQVSEALAGLDAPLDALHLVSHGSSQELWLGDTRLTADGLDAFESQLAGWKGALAPDADLLIYGCNLAAGEEGRALLAGLGALTGADLAASDDVTGLGGDWHLEYQAGALETSVAFSARVQASWGGRLAAAPLGPVIPVNIATGGAQSLATGTDNADGVAMAPDGSFAVVWQRSSAGADIFVRLFNADGSPKTGDLPVNDVTPSVQVEPSIAMDDAGDFVVVFAGSGPGDGDGIFARRFNADGSPKALEFRVNTTTSNVQLEPVVAMDADGDFVVAWWGEGIGDTTGVFFQRYDSLGAPQGSETLVNLGATTGSQGQPDIAMHPSGSFVITWSGRAPGDMTGIWAQRFDATGVPQGGRIDVNWETFGIQYAPAVEMADDGSFVVAWSGEGATESNGVFFRRFDATGSPLGTDVNVTSNGSTQERPDLAMDSAGNFVVTWMGDDGGDWDIYSRSYLSDGTPEGSATLVNASYTSNDQMTPSIAMNAPGDHVIAWDGGGATDSSGVYAQRFERLNTAPVLDPAGPSLPDINEDQINNPGVLVSTLLAGVTDPDPGVLGGMALFGLTTTSGNWEFNTGSGWTAVGTVTPTSALLLRDSDRVRFVPDAENGGGGSLAFRAWDRTDGASQGTKVDPGAGGGTSAFSAASDTATITSDAVNDAPILDASAPMRFTPVAANDADPAGDTVAALILSATGDRITDVDTASNEGIAVIGVDDTYGTWEYSIDGGGSWVSFGFVSNTSAVLLDDAAHVRFVPDADFFGPVAGFEFRAWDRTSGSNGQTGVDVTATGGVNAFSMASEEAGVYVTGDLGFLLSTASDVSAGGQTGFDTWSEGDIVGMANPNLAFERATPPQDTDGSFSVAFDIDVFATGAKTDGVHRVSRDIQVGSSNFQLRKGDLLLTLDDNSQALTSESTPSAPGFSNSLTVEQEDVFVFRPDTPGDYGSGTFAMLLDNPMASSIRGITLIETDTRVGDADLDAGDFLLTEEGADDTVWLYETADVGPFPATGGVPKILLAGSDVGVGIYDKLWGIDLVEEGMTVGGRTLATGTLLLSIKSPDVVGGNALGVGSSDIFALTVDKTTLVAGAGNGEATASLFFEGGDVAFAAVEESLDGFSLYDAVPSAAPTLSPFGPSFTGINEDQLTNAGEPVALLLGSAVADSDAGALEGIAVTGLAAGNGTWQFSTDGGGSWLAVGSVSDSSALLLRDLDRLRFVPDGDNGESPDPSISYRAWDQTLGSPGTRADASSPGGSSAFSSATDTATIQVADVNDAPALGDAGVLAVDQDTLNPPGETVAALFGSSFVDVDSGAAFLGIAVVGNAAPAAEGVWQYSSDAGANWADVGSVADGATALAIQATSLLRFLPAPGYNGNPTDLVLRGLDDTYAGFWSTTTGGTETRVAVDTGSPGGTTPIAAATSTLSTSISSLNDARIWIADQTPDVLEFTPTQLETPGTVGSFSGSLDASNFGAGFSFDAIHYVSTPQALGGVGLNAIGAQPGDLLLSVDAGSTTLTGLNSLPVTGDDIIHFRPQAPGDYSNGTFTMFADNLGGGWFVTSFTLIESNTTLPGSGASAQGSFLYTRLDPASNGRRVLHYDPGTGGSTVVIDGDNDDPGFEDGGYITGLDVVESSFTAGGRSFTPGQVLLSLGFGSEVGNNDIFVRNEDLFVLDMFSPSSFNATKVFDGSDVGLGRVWGVSFTPDAGTGGPGNSAPVLDSTGPFTFTDVAEDDTAPPGDTVAALLASDPTPPAITDADLLPQEGIAVTAVDDTNGMWQFKIGSGSWQNVGSVSATSALILRSTDDLRFIPSSDWFGNANISFQAWDRTDGAAPGSKLNPGPGGGTSAYSLIAASATLTVNPVNDAPSIANGFLAAVDEDTGSPPGATIDSLFAAGFIDADGTFEGVAITNDNSVAAEGVWQYSSDAGANWADIGSVANNNALVIAKDSLLRFLPASEYSGNPGELRLRAADDSYAGAWSTTTGGSETRVQVPTDASNNGDGTPFANSRSDLDTSIDAVNDAPTLGDASLTAVDEDTTNPPGATISSLFGAGFGDVDALSSFFGVAIVGNAAPAAEGVWQYSSDAGANWFAVGAVGDDATALAIQASSLLRFVPAGDYNGTPTDLVLRGVDDSYAGSWSTTAAGETRVTVDTTAPGGTTPITAATSALSTSINAINDAPTLGDASLTAVDEDTTNPPGATISSLFGAGFGDVDALSSFFGVAIVGNAAPAAEGVWQYSSDAGANWFAVGAVADDATALAIEKASLLRFVPAGDYNGTPTDLVLRGLDNTYGAGWSTTGGGEIRVSVDTTTRGGITAITDATSDLSTSINAINDAPTLGDATLAAVDEDTTSPPGATITSLLGAGFGDVDASSSFAGIAVVGNAALAAEGVWQYSSDSGTTWAAVGSVDDTGNALAIQASSLLRFVPAANYNGTPTDLVLRGLDDSYAGLWSTTGGGEIRVGVDTTTRGGITAIADATSDLSTSINAVNDAPTLGDAILTAVDEDTTSPPGATIASLLGAGFSDIDASSSFAGVAVVGNTAPAAEGVWQYSSDAGTTWFAVGTVADDATALAIEKASLLRFVPAGDYNGTPTDLVLRGLDDTYSASWSTTGGGEIRVSVDTTTRGGITAITDATSDLSTSINAINDAPTLGDASLTAVDEDTTSPPGATISSLFGAGFGDVDGGTFGGAAVVGNTAPAGQGVWQYSSDSGTTWAAVGSVNDTGSALAIQASSLLRFVPAANYNGTPNDLVLRGLDDTYSAGWSTTGGGEIRVGVDTTTRGGITAITDATSDLSTSINAINDAPTLGDAALAAVDEDTTSPPGATIASLLGAGFGDIDASSSFAGIAVVGNAAPAAQGVWQYSSDAGTTWVAVGTVDDTGSALAIQATSLLRFLPAGDYNGSPTDLALRGLDDSYAGAWSTTGGGETRETIDTTSPGGTTAITAATSTLGTSINAVNDPPTLGDATLAAVDEDTTNPLGASIDSLFGAGFGDIDAGASFLGIAVVGNAAPASEGAWQYSSDAGATWFAIGSVADDATALAIEKASLLRFVPAADYNGTPTDLVLRGLDNTYAGSWSNTGGGETRVNVDTTTSGGATPIAAATSALSTSINGANEAPVLDSSGSLSLTDVTEDDLNPPGNSVAEILASDAPPDRLTDADPGALEGIAVTGVDAANGTWQYQLGAGPWLDVGSVDASNALLLRDGDRLRFVPDPDVNGSAGDVSFRAWDRSDAALPGSRVAPGPGGGSSAFSLLEASASVTVLPVNDAPLLDGTAPFALSGVTANDTDPAGNSVAQILASAAPPDRLTDVDAGALEGIAIVGADEANGTWQFKLGAGPWTDVGSVNATSALLLGSGDRLRFVPDTGYSGTAGNLIFRGWDRSDAALAGSLASPGLGGAASAFSVGGGVATLEVDPGGLVIPDPDPDPIPDPDPDPTPDPPPIGGDPDPVVTALPEGPGRGRLPSVSAPPSDIDFSLASQPVRPRLGLELTEETRTNVEDRSGSVRQLLERHFIDSQTALSGELNRLREVADGRLQLGDALTVSSLGLATTLSIGYVVWLTQGGLLVASLVSSMPAWRLIDPLPVLAGHRHGGEDDESLTSMVEASASAGEEPPTPEPPPEARPSEPETAPK